MERELTGLTIRVADTFLSRFLGLMGRVPRRDTALMLQPCRWVHTFFMLVPIDVVFLDKEGRVIKVCRNLKPFRAAGPVKKAWAVLEMAQGEAERRGIEEGGRLEFGGKNRQYVLNVSYLGQEMRPGT